MTVEILVAPHDGWQDWPQEKIDQAFEDYEGEQVAKNIWWTYFIATVHSTFGPIKSRWPVLHKFAVECVLDSVGTVSFLSELDRLRNEFAKCPATLLRRVNFPEAMNIPYEVEVSREQLDQAMAAEIQHMRLAIEEPDLFVRECTEEMETSVAEHFITNELCGNPLPKNMLELFDLPLTALPAICEKAINKGTGVVCY